MSTIIDAQTERTKLREKARVIKAHIEERAAQLADLEKQLKELDDKLEPWSIQGGQFCIANTGVVHNEKDEEEIRTRLFGMERSTYYMAERAATAMYVFNRLLAYRDEFDPGYEWVSGADNTFIFYDTYHKVWNCGWNEYQRSPDRVYMSRAVCEQLVIKLNAGLVTL